MNLPVRLSTAAGFASLLLGAVVLLGWYLHEPALIQVNPAFVPMQYNTALGFALGGLALLFLVMACNRAAVVLGSLVFLVGILTLVQYIFGVDLHIDQLLMTHYIDVETSHPGRMAPNTALCFSLTGLAVFLSLSHQRSTGATSRVAVVGALIIGLGIVALAGYFVGVKSAYGWGHMTRMAIHTAAGFVTLGIGFVALAWGWDKQRYPERRFPGWIPVVITITGLTITFALWQAMLVREQSMIEMMDAEGKSFADESLLIFGLLFTMALAVSARQTCKADIEKRKVERIYAPYVVVFLGLLLSLSLYGLLEKNFEASVKGHFDSATQSHADAIEQGFVTYLETLYHVRSGFYASSFVDRSEFRTLVDRSLERLPGIMALEWVPLVFDQDRDAMETRAREEVAPGFVFGDAPTKEGMTQAPRRDRYFPIYYIEPMEGNAAILGFDLAGKPEWLAALQSAIKINGPAASSRFHLLHSQQERYSVSVALPVYRENLPLESVVERETALKGFVLMVVDVGEMVETILDTYTSPEGLTLDFEDKAAPVDKQFIYRHISRIATHDLNEEGGVPADNTMTDTIPLDFADRNWEMTAFSANHEIYPAWNAGSFWLPIGVFLLSLGVAAYIRKSTQREQERARLLAFQVALLDSIPNPIFVKNTDGVFTACNKAYEKAFGTNRREFVGKTVLELDYLPQDERSAFQQADLDLIQKGGYTQEEISIKWADGVNHDVMYWRTTFELADGKPGGMIGGLFDITERKKAEHELIHSERQYRVLVDTIPGTVYRCQLDENWTMLFISKEVEVLTGYPPSDFLNNSKRSFASVIHPDDTALVDETVAQAVAAHRPYMIEYRVICADGKIRHVYERGQAEYADSGEAEVLDGTIIDVTELKKLQTDLEQAKEAADAANQAKSAFLANMSHELRTPMNAILGYSEMLMEEAEDLQQEAFIPDLKKINQAGSHLLALINDILDLSKIEAGRMEAFAEDLDVGTLIDEVCGTAQPLMAKNDNRLIIERGEGLGKAHQDLTKLRQSLFNLLSNAAKFTHGGSVTLKTTRSRLKGEDWLSFNVSDTGIGIPADKVDRVFEEFSQADNSTTRNYGGTGLGLAITRRFCQMLGGDITLVSTPGKGTVFTIRIPAVLPGTRVEEAAAEPVITKTDEELEVIRRAGGGHTVLVIDDDPEACEIIERFLNKDGFEVVTAGSGEEGLRLAHAVKPLAITLDVMMPDMDGWSVLRALKADPDLHDVPVLMLTMIDDKSKGYSLGATDYLTKPVDREQLHRALAKYHCPESPCQVLLVEDDPDTREVMSRALEKVGWAVTEAANGREALDKMPQIQPKLILLDLMMPVMDGFDFLIEMRANPDWHDIPVIVVTAKDLSEEDRQVLSGKVEDVLEKGAYSRDQLLSRIRDLVTECGLQENSAPASEQ